MCCLALSFAPPTLKPLKLWGAFGCCFLAQSSKAELVGSGKDLPVEDYIRMSQASPLAGKPLQASWLSKDLPTLLPGAAGATVVALARYQEDWNACCKLLPAADPEAVLKLLLCSPGVQQADCWP